MKSVLLVIVAIQSINAFTQFPPSAFTGHDSSVVGTRNDDYASMNRQSFNRITPLHLKILGRKIGGGGGGGDTATEEPTTVTKITTNEDGEEVCEIVELSETEKLLKQVKEAGTAGVISYALWEMGFWTLSVPVCVFGYYEVTGHWPDFSNQDDMAKLGGEAFAFVNFARFAVPLRIGLALGTTPWIQKNVLDRFFKKDDEQCEPMDEVDMEEIAAELES